MTTILRDSQKLAALTTLLYDRISPQCDVLREMLRMRDREDDAAFFDGAMFGIVTGFIFEEEPDATLEDVTPAWVAVMAYVEEMHGDAPEGKDADTILRELVPDAFADEVAS